jgi:HEAT repeat protein
MTKPQPASTRVESLIGLLASKDGLIRPKARTSLVALGKPAVPSLIKALQDSELDHVRWEAAKALGAIGDTKSILALVEALEDGDSDVAWLAADALARFKKAAWPPLLQRLIKRGVDSDALRQGAHHILWQQKEKGFDGVLGTLKRALDPTKDPGSVPLAASAVLRQLKGKP